MRISAQNNDERLLLFGRVRELLKIVSTRISLHFPQMQGSTRFFRNGQQLIDKTQKSRIVIILWNRSNRKKSREDPYKFLAGIIP